MKGGAAGVSPPNTPLVVPSFNVIWVSGLLDRIRLLVFDTEWGLPHKTSLPAADVRHLVVVVGGIPED